MADKTRVNDLNPPEPAVAPQQSIPAPQPMRKPSLQRTHGNRFLAERAGGSISNPLPPHLRQSMGRAFGANLSDVRLHTGSQAAAAADALHADAFATGQDIYFAPSKYQPETPSGRRLLAHEIAHTVQQGTTPHDQGVTRVTTPGEPAEQQADYAANTAMAGGVVPPGALSGTAPGVIARQESAPPAAPPTAPSSAAGAPADEISLASATFTPTPAVEEVLEGAGSRGGEVRVRLGSIAAGAIRVRKRGGRRDDAPIYETPGDRPQAIPLTLPVLQALADAGVNPVLAVRISDNQITGYVTIDTGRGAVGNQAALLDWVKNHTREFGWAGIDVSSFPRATNELTDGVLRLQVNDFAFTLGGYVQGQGAFGITNETVTFNANGTIRVGGLTEAQLEISRNETGQLHARTEIPVTLANFSGNLIAEYGNGTFNIEGTVSYRAEKFSGEVTLIVTDAATARQVAMRRLGPDAIAGSAEEAAGAESAAEGPRPGPRAVAGWGVLNFAVTEWLTGQAQVIIDNEGHITVVGEIRPPAEVELFPQRDYVRELFTLEVRTLYGVPLVGNVFLFANIGLAALAKLGPGKIYNIVLQGTYSTDPNVLQNFSIAGSINISAFAGLRLRAEGGLGVELLGHDIKAGVGLEAIGGVRGYVEATPTIGYRETAEPEAGKQGEFYIQGHMELAAQPFLGLSGDLFVELDSPWWSPAPDKKWTWPLGSLEYPLPGEFGIGADVEYVLGSDQLPEIQFGEVAFDKDKFMTDLVNDHVPPRSQGEQERQGEWAEGTPNGQGEVDPALALAGGAPPEGQPATGQQQPGEGQPPSPANQQRWLEGLRALGTLATESQRDPLNRTELDARLETIKTTYGFTSLRVSQSGEDWLIFPAMSPPSPNPITVQGEPGGATGQEPPTQRPDWIPATATDEQVRRILALISRAHRLGSARGSQVNEAFIRAEIRSASQLETAINNLESALERGERQVAATQSEVAGATPENVAETMGVQPTEQQPFRTQQHHIFPRSQRFAARWRALGIDIDRYVISIDAERHQEEAHAGGMRDRMRGIRIPGLSGGGAFNQDWIDYFADKERRGETPTPRGIYQKAQNILAKYGLTNMRLHVYNNPDQETSLSELLNL